MAATEEPGKPRNWQERIASLQDRLYDRVFHNYLWQSVFRSGYPNTPRNQMLVIATNVFLHLHPTRLHRTHVKVTHTYCLGGLSFFMFIILTVTGVLLMFYYVPSTDRAYTDIAALETNVAFGMLMRNLHRWTAHAMVILLFLHMMRVFYTGAYKPPREFNWVVGVILLVLTLLLSFTGYLLPWDQLALWAINVGFNIAGSAPQLGGESSYVLFGGFEINDAALIRFYTLHVIALPLLAAIFMSVHFWRIRRDGGLARPL
jgi:quinol-cytochrome oxidoreductase complex cytochrome b subunit